VSASARFGRSFSTTVVVSGLLLSAFSGGAAGQSEPGWILFPPSEESSEPVAPPNTEGAAYVENLLGAYGNSFFATEPSTPDELRKACVDRLKTVVGQLGYTLTGFAFELSISLQGAIPPYQGVSCRIHARNDLAVTIEVKEN
jgi:hypothetical protein